MDMWIEVKLSPAFDPFVDSDPRKSFHHHSMAAHHTQGQLVAYANAQWARQFRTRFFSLLITGHRARILLWDRSCIITTESFDYVQRPHLLATFFWKYHSLSPELRGYDTSVTDPSPDEVSASRTALRITSKNNSFRKLRVAECGEPDLFYIVETPPFGWRSAIGRGSRGLPAYDLENETVVWVKDYWRVDAPSIEKEADVYRELHRSGVPHIPRLSRGGDVTGGPLCTTSNHKRRTDAWACRIPEIETYTKYRLVLEDVGKDLTSFASSWEFVNAIADGIEGN
jgi:hypothetical protein